MNSADHTLRLRRWNAPLSTDMTAEVVNRLLTFPFFGNLDRTKHDDGVAIKDILTNDSRVVRFRRGDIVFRESDDADSAFFVISGELNLEVQPRKTCLLADSDIGLRGTLADPRLYLLDVDSVLAHNNLAFKIPAGQLFGEAVALGPRSRTATVFALSEAEVLEIRWEGVRDMMSGPYLNSLKEKVEQFDPMEGIDPTQPPFEAHDGSEPYIFVSYAHHDCASVYSELLRLKSRGYRIWYDEGVTPGNDWAQEIGEALIACTFFLVFISPSAVESENVTNEINMALNRKKPFVAVYLERTRLSPGLELRMGDVQAIYRFNMESDDRYYQQINKAMPNSLIATQ